MPIRFVLLLALFVGGYFLFRRSRRSPQALIVLVFWGCLILFIIPGGFEMLIPLFIIAIPLLFRYFKARLPSTLTPPTSQPVAAINARFLRMTFGQNENAISGIVREGRLAGAQLQQLDFQQCLALWHECRVDPRSLALLEAYLDQRFGPKWRDHVDYGTNADSSNLSGVMHRAEAYEILGLTAGANRSEIQAAYRRLIQRLHPDQGGSVYLAACLNRARDVLLDDGTKESA